DDLLKQVLIAMIITSALGLLQMRLLYQSRETEAHPGGRRFRSASRRHQSSPSGGWLQGPRHCHRGNIRRTGCNLSTADQSEISPSLRTPAAGQTHRAERSG